MALPKNLSPYAKDIIGANAAIVNRPLRGPAAGVLPKTSVES